MQKSGDVLCGRAGFQSGRRRAHLGRATTKVLRAKKSSTSFTPPRAESRHGDANSGHGAVEGFTEMAKEVFASVGKGVVALSLTGALLTGAPAVEARELSFPASGNPDVFTVQRTLLEAWSIVRDTFVDGDGGVEWEQELGDSLMNAYRSQNGKEAYHAIEKMLKDVPDPYTRIIPPEEYTEFRVNSDGQLQGVGLLIAADPSNGKLMVLASIKGSPADRAGIIAGDELVSIDGKSTQGLNGPGAAKILRGQNGTSVRVKLARRTDQIPGVPGTPEPLPQATTKLFTLRREVVQLSPVFYGKVREAEEDYGYIKLTNFSSKAAADMRNAVVDLEEQGVRAFILDLRNNPGGLVDAGMDVARLWLDGSPTIFKIAGRGSYEMQGIALSDGEALTDLPLVVLVNEGSASASEILAGALKDSHRASLIGDKTYGKGKIQTVYELQDGSALFVTVARYKTPEEHDIDMVGIMPDMACRPALAGEAPPGKGEPTAMQGKTVLETDLEMDDCFLTAERFLYQQAHEI
ncbi:hypothetical protein BSKO_10854 [Bryopsis sp. KO-2023]|nr:hypothetical protein BSKO_10854 [Bryopsis sp. KO-2023]